MSPLGDALLAALSCLPAGAGIPVAVSGGLDSWVLALLLRRLGREVAGYTLVSRVQGYCEWEQTLSLAGQFDVPVHPIEVASFDAALPRFLTVTRTPIYNLHPVSKLLLAEALAARGIAHIVTGDAADQVFRCESDCDLLPLTQACFRHCQVELITPFLAPEVRALCTVPDPDKRPLRELAAALGIPPIPKRPTLYPGSHILTHSTQMLEALQCAASPG
jgi:hypothetical protein